MAPSVVININFENKNGYSPGETVKGQVEVIFKKNMAVKAISVYAIGLSQTKFQKFRLFKFNLEEFVEQEEYYSKFVPLFQKGASSHKFSKGTYRYDFSYDLSLDIPSSFESKFGFVRHFCKAVVSPDDQMGIDIEFPVLYNVLAPYDLKDEPSAKAKIQFTGEENLCCTKGFISLIVNVDRSGYIPGEKLVMNAECTNASDRPTVSKAKLYQIITCTANGNTKTERKLISSKAHPQVSPGNDDTWSDESMLIPRLISSELRGCRLIDIEYKFKFQIRPVGFPTKLETTSPILIGTISLNEANIYPIQAPTAPFMVPESPSSPSAPPPPYAEANPNKTINISLTLN